MKNNYNSVAALNEIERSRLPNPDNISARRAAKLQDFPLDCPQTAQDLQFDALRRKIPAAGKIIARFYVNSYYGILFAHFCIRCASFRIMQFCGRTPLPAAISEKISY